MMDCFRYTRACWAGILGITVDFNLYKSPMQGFFKYGGLADFPFSSRAPVLLSDVLTSFRHWENGDPRDTVYAVLSLARTVKGVEPIRPQYFKSAIDVFVDVIEYIIKTEKSLCLIYVPWAPDIPGLPTWIIPKVKDPMLQADRRQAIIDWKTGPYSDYLADHLPHIKASVARLGCFESTETALSQKHVLKADGAILHQVTSGKEISSDYLVGCILEKASQRFCSFSHAIPTWQDRKTGDCIVLLNSCLSPILLRPTTDGFILIGRFIYSLLFRPKKKHELSFLALVHSQQRRFDIY